MHWSNAPLRLRWDVRRSRCWQSPWSDQKTRRGLSSETTCTVYVQRLYRILNRKILSTVRLTLTFHSTCISIFLYLSLRIAKSSEQLKVGVHERATSEFCCVECGPQDVGGLTVHSFCKRMVLLNDRTSVIAKNYMAILSFEYRSKPTYVP